MNGTIRTPGSIAALALLLAAGTVGAAPFVCRGVEIKADMKPALVQTLCGKPAEKVSKAPKVTYSNAAGEVISQQTLDHEEWLYKGERDTDPSYSLRFVNGLLYNVSEVKPSDQAKTQ